MTSTPSTTFDLDAALGDLSEKPLTYKSQTFTLPAEFPAACLTPFLADDLGLIDLISEAWDEADDDAQVPDLVLAVLKKRNKLPLELVAAARTALETLMDTESEGQFAEFSALNPSVPAYLLIARGIVTDYGMALTDFFGSPEPSVDGEPSKETSPASTPEAPKETSATSSDAPETPGSSE